MDSIKNEIYKLENYLLLSVTRKSPEKISELLDDTFVEYTSSGKEYHYKKGDVFQDKEDNSELDWQIKDFKVKKIAEECILATYKVVKNDEEDERKKYSLRSSIWKCIGGKWKMIFHQGTLCGRFE